mmetsp:Transcript_16558/g.30051  ORF Transcript_16558/g.30051 Transcript_16558/m.30051 type:complete len:107 (-) Transcript_16558:248-568(-)
MTFFVTAAWLQHISGPTPNLQVDKKDLGILRDLRAMKDAETKDGVHSLPLLRHGSRSRTRNVTRIGRAHMQQQQPQPKFVAHKDPTRGKKRKDEVKSNHLGRSYMA